MLKIQAPSRSPTVQSHGRRQSGMSIVELLVGVAVGLFVVAGAATLAATQLGENRRLLLEAQLQQDLRAAADVMSREIRRAGARQFPEQYVWTPGKVGILDLSVDNHISPTGTSVTSAITFRYYRQELVVRDLGYQLSGSKVRTKVVGSFEDLTDPGIMTVDSFTVTPSHAVEPTPAAPTPQRLPCPKLCPDGTSDCWPSMRVREFAVQTDATSTSDGAVRRSLGFVVRPRNDELLRDAAVVGTAAAAVCPA
jgi:type II secretory pathway pseudopilin PulG